MAGNGSHGFSGDGGAATAAVLDNPLNVAVDGIGNLYISDSGNQRVRKVTFSSAIISVQSGNWSSAATWNCTCLPSANDVVTITAGHTVTVSQPVQAQALKQNGALLFATGGKLTF